jgi:hypothetical protein
MANSYVTGTLVRLSAVFQQAGANVDPGLVVAQLKDPSGTLTALTTLRDGVGLYHADFTPSLAGVHYYRFTGSQGVTVANESAFVVSAAKVS